MIVGDNLIFAIESEILQAYEQLSYRALGFFLIHVNGCCYGVKKQDASMLACSLAEVKRRILNRGKHIAEFSELDAGLIAGAFRNALYAENQEDKYFGMTIDKFCMNFNRAANDLMWAPDGDAAFDDGSYVLQFDLRDRVRLIAFKSDHGYGYDPATLSEIWMPGDSFYLILQEWCDAFEAEWERLPKRKAR